MVDDDFLLAPVIAAYLLDTAEGRARAAAFLQRKSPEGVRYGELLSRNLRFVAARAQPFAQTPAYHNMISLLPGITVGEWRDSQKGLGGDGRYAYNINGVFVPAALDAAVRLRASGLLTPYGGDLSDLGDLSTMARVWAREAPRLFEVSLTAGEANDRVAAFAKLRGVPQIASASAPVRFHALALDAQGAPVPVLHSDEGFLLLFGNPDARQLDVALRSIMQPYPAGLVTSAGMLVANPALATPDRYPVFDKTRYHGEVTWSWQQGLMVAGIKRQLGRTDLPEESRALLRVAQAKIASVLRSTHTIRGSELWSWHYKDGRYAVAPFGQNSGDETESNSVQLWSTIGLATACTEVTN
ncbi:MAG: hypothetical protein IBJ12_08580 [Sphingomonadaceae bacterium]|nr:hypothetical protein [Sphingomonadaceae bacterium]